MIQSFSFKTYQFVLREGRFCEIAGLCGKWAKVSGKKIPGDIKKTLAYVSRMGAGFSWPSLLASLENSICLIREGSWERVGIACIKTISLATVCAEIAAGEVLKKEFEWLPRVRQVSKISRNFLRIKSLWKLGEKRLDAGWDYWKVGLKGLSSGLHIIKIFHISDSFVLGWISVCIRTSILATDFFEYMQKGWSEKE